jgi:hypothetical protein
MQIPLRGLAYRAPNNALDVQYNDNNNRVANTGRRS